MKSPLVFRLAVAGLALLTFTAAADPRDAVGNLEHLGRVGLLSAPLFRADSLGDGRVLLMDTMKIWDQGTGALTFLDPPQLCFHVAGTTTRLIDGRYFFAGGRDCISSTAIWEPRAATWNPSPPLLQGRTGHTATLLSDGTVLLVAGGQPEQTGDDEQLQVARALSAVELFDGSEMKSLPPLSVARMSHTATRLKDGRVLVVGGTGSEQRALRSVDLWDPKHNVWRSIQPLQIARTYHSAHLLDDGRVMVFGGVNERGMPMRTVEIWNPANEQWRPGKPLLVPVGRHVAVALANGNILLAANDKDACPSRPEAIPMLMWDAATDEWQVANRFPLGAEHVALAPLDGGAALIVTEHSVLRWTGLPIRSQAIPLYPNRTLVETRLADGRLMLVGDRHLQTVRCQGVLAGSEADRERMAQLNARMGLPADTHWELLHPVPPTNLVELYDPATQRFSATAPLNVARAEAKVLTLHDGRVLVVGGFATRDDEPKVADDTPAELWDPGTGRWRVLRSELRTKLHELVDLNELASGDVLLVFHPANREESGKDGLHAVLWNPTTDRVTRKKVNLPPRDHPGAVVLRDGRVLYVGTDAEGSTGAAVWDSRTGEVIELAPPRSAAGPWSSLLLANGQVLQVQTPEGASVSPTRIWDPATGKWIEIAPLPSRHEPDHRLLEVGDGTVYAETAKSGFWLARAAGEWSPDAGRDFAAEGLSASLAARWNGNGPLERLAYLGKQPKWEEVSTGYIPRHRPALVPLQDGRLMVAGGVGERRVQIWDPAAMTWELTAPLPEPYVKPQGVQLPSGKVLVVGGKGQNIGCALWDPGSGGWTACGDLGGPVDKASLRLFEGHALLVVKTGARVYDEAANDWQSGSGYTSDQGQRTSCAEKGFDQIPRVKVHMPGGESKDISDLFAELPNGGLFRAAVRLQNGKLLTSNLEVMEPGIPRCTPVPGRKPFDKRPDDLVALRDGCVLGYAPLYIVGRDGGSLREVPELYLAMTDASVASLADGKVVFAGYPTEVADVANGGFAWISASCEGVSGLGGSIGGPDGPTSSVAFELAPPPMAAAPVEQAPPAAEPSPSPSAFAQAWLLIKRYSFQVVLIAGVAAWYYWRRKRASEAPAGPAPVPQKKSCLMCLLLRLTMYAVLILGVMISLYGLGRGSIAAHVAQCEMGPLLRAEHANALEHSKALIGCVEERGGLLEKLVIYRDKQKVMALPALDCYYVGVWDSRSERGGRFTVTMRNDGTFFAERESGSFGNHAGYWGVLDSEMVWLYSQGRVWPPDVNAILEKDDTHFKLRERDWTTTTFTRIEKGECAAR